MKGVDISQRSSAASASVAARPDRRRGRFGAAAGRWSRTAVEADEKDQDQDGHGPEEAQDAPPTKRRRVWQIRTKEENTIQDAKANIQKRLAEFAWQWHWDNKEAATNACKKAIQSINKSGKACGALIGNTLAHDISTDACRVSWMISARQDMFMDIRHNFPEFCDSPMGSGRVGLFREATPEKVCTIISCGMAELVEKRVLNAPSMIKGWCAALSITPTVPKKFGLQLLSE